MELEERERGESGEEGEIASIFEVSITHVNDFFEPVKFIVTRAKILNWRKSATVRARWGLFRSNPPRRPVLHPVRDTIVL